MKNREFDDPVKAVLAKPINTNSEEFKETQALLLNISREHTEEQKLEIELMAIKFKMQDYLHSEQVKIEPAGKFLRRFLQITHISQKRLAEYIGLKPSNLNKLISGERAINHEQALIFGAIFNTDPLIWLRVQSKNEIKKLLSSKSRNYQKYSLSDLKRA